MMAGYKIRHRERVQSSRPDGLRPSWVEYQIVSGRKIVARLETMRQAEKALLALEGKTEP